MSEDETKALPTEEAGAASAGSASVHEASGQGASAAELNEVQKRLEGVQEQIRHATHQRAQFIQNNQRKELPAIDETLATLRQQRQALLDEELRLRRARSMPDAPPLPTTALPASVAPRVVPRAQRMPPLALRLVVLLLVLGGVAAVVLGGISFVAARLQPPPIEGIDGMAESGSDDFALEEGQTIEERGLAIYLALNQDRIERAPSDDPTPVIFRVELGENATTVAEQLESAGLVEDAELFRRLIRYRGADQSLEAGVYELARNMTMDEIIVALQQGRLEEVAVTLPEGWRAEQMAEYLEGEGIGSAEEYMGLVREPSRFDYDFLADLPAGSTVEGYLFPDTYRVVREEITPEAFIRLQLDNFGQRLTPELRAAAQERGMTVHQAVILASIVEREAVVAEERETIAGVYINRWQDGTVLNADPTIQYALGYQAESGEWWKRPLSSEDLQLDSPYNTYTVAGLPPGPIGNPGLDSIRSTIVAPDTDFYYFVSRNDGTHVFAVTFEEHLQNVQLYQSGN